MSAFLNLGIPDLPIRAFQPDALGRLAGLHGGKGGDAPDPPDYRAAAEATAEGNLELAKYTAQANRMNQYTPWGSLTYTNEREFDQAGYDAAMAAYERQLEAQNQIPQFGPNVGQYVTTYSPLGYGEGGGGDVAHRTPVSELFGGGQGGMGLMSIPKGGLQAPSRDDFYGDDNWSQHVELAPELQAQLEQQWRLQQGMFGAQDAALGRVNQTLSQGFDTSGLTPGGQVLDMDSLPGLGEALDPSKIRSVNTTLGAGSGSSLSGGQVLDIGSLPGAGRVLDTSSLPGFGSVLNRGDLPDAGQVYDPTLETNRATDLIMQRVNPELDRQYEALRTQLANQGIAQGSEAYQREMDRFGQQRNDAANQAALYGIDLGMQQQGMMFDQSTTNRGMEAGLQQREYAQQTGKRELAATNQAQQFGQATTNRQMEAALQDMRFQHQSTNQQVGAQIAQQAFMQQLAAAQHDAALQQQQFGQMTQNQQLAAALQGQQFGQAESARARDMSEAAYLRNLPLQELSALTGGQQVGMPQFPGYAMQAQTAGPDLVGAANAQYGADLGAWNAQQAQAGQMAQGFGSMGGALGSMFGGPVGGLVGNIGGSLLGGLFSDRRLKRNIKAIGKADNGLTIYSYQYVTGGPTQLGYMADEVQKVAPDAVGEQNGYLTVDYSKV